MSKQFGNYYVTEAKKVLKQSDKLYCKVEEKSILLCNGNLVFKMNKYEYEQIARPITCRDAGNWAIIRGEVSNSVPDLFRIWNEYTTKADDMPLIEKSELFTKRDKWELQLFYVPETCKAMAFNSLYTGAIAESLLKGNGSDSFMVAYDGNSEPFAVLLPVNIKQNAELQRAIHAFYVRDETTDAQNMIADLKEHIEYLSSENNRQRRLRREKDERIKELEAALAIATPVVS